MPLIRRLQTSKLKSPDCSSRFGAVAVWAVVMYLIAAHPGRRTYRLGSHRPDMVEMV